MATKPPVFVKDFYDTDPIGGQRGSINIQKIYVPAASVEAYKRAEGWKNYANIIVAL